MSASIAVNGNQSSFLVGMLQLRAVKASLTWSRSTNPLTDYAAYHCKPLFHGIEFHNDVLSLFILLGVNGPLRSISWQNSNPTEATVTRSAATLKMPIHSFA